MYIDRDPTRSDSLDRYNRYTGMPQEAPKNWWVPVTIIVLLLVALNIAHAYLV